MGNVGFTGVPTNMAAITHKDIATLLRKDLSLPGSVAELHTRYQGVRPLPHLILDNLFPGEVLDAVVAEAPQANHDNWLFVEADGLQQVLRMRTAVEMGSASYHSLQGFWYRFLVGAKVVEFERAFNGANEPQARLAALSRASGYELGAVPNSSS
jgi:hypothetical protein